MLEIIKKWLLLMGVDESALDLRETLLKVDMQTTSEVYKVYFRISSDGKRIIFDSSVFKNASGHEKSLYTFQKTMNLMDGGSEGYLTFATVQRNGFPDEWRIILRGSLPQNSITIHNILDVMNEFHYLYDDNVPFLRELAEELDIDFNGRLSNTLKLILNDFNKDDNDST